MNNGIGIRVFFVIAALLIGTQAWVIVDSRSTISGRERAAVEQAKPAELSITTIRDASCADCAAFDGFIARIKEQRVAVTSERTLERVDADAGALIAQYGITRIPALVVTGEVGKHESVRTFFEGSGGAIANGAFVANTPGAPYVDVATNAVVGRLALTRIVDRDCTTCYDVIVHDTILNGYGVPTPPTAETIDVASPEGRTLIAKHKITAVPAFILRGELDRYPALAQVWSTVGTREEGNVAVFRKSGVAQMGVYRDLATGRIITPKPAASAPTK